MEEGFNRATDGRTDGREAISLDSHTSRRERGCEKRVKESARLLLSRSFAIFLGSANSENAFERGFIEMLLQHH